MSFGLRNVQLGFSWSSLQIFHFVKHTGSIQMGETQLISSTSSFPYSLKRLFFFSFLNNENPLKAGDCKIMLLCNKNKSYLLFQDALSPTTIDISGR